MIGIVGAGLAGSMTALLLSKAGYKICLFEKRNDPRVSENVEVNSAFGLSTSATKRSINLALSNRGMAALQEAGLLEEALSDSIQMSGRIIHNEVGQPLWQQYGTKEQALYSVSRQKLNIMLLNHLSNRSDLDKESVSIFFGYTLISANEDGHCIFRTSDESKKSFDFDLVIGADGAYSIVREQLLRQGRIDFSRQYIEHGYKELHIPPIFDTNGNVNYALPSHLNQQGLHIWPRKEFMLIALPNADKSFTATLFAPYHGERGGFDSIDPKDSESILSHFKSYFPDVVPLMPTLTEDYANNPVGSLVTVRVKPWNLGKLLLLGDSAHAVVPFYGQGMNAAFEDALVLFELLKESKKEGGTVDLPKISETFASIRMPALDGLADLCIEHYHDMAANTASIFYLISKKLEAGLHAVLPHNFVPLYTMVSFSRIPYHEALERSKKQETTVRYTLIISSIAIGICSIVYLRSLRN